MVDSSQRKSSLSVLLILGTVALLIFAFNLWRDTFLLILALLVAVASLLPAALLVRMEADQKGRRRLHHLWAKGAGLLVTSFVFSLFVAIGKVPVTWYSPMFCPVAYGTLLPQIKTVQRSFHEPGEFGIEFPYRCTGEFGSIIAPPHAFEGVVLVHFLPTLACLLLARLLARRKLERRVVILGSVLPVVGLLALVGFDGPVKRSVVRATTDLLFPHHPQSLIAATRAGDLELVRDLLERGADPLLQVDDNRTTAYGIAGKNRNRDLLALFGDNTTEGSAHKVRLLEMGYIFDEEAILRAIRDADLEALTLFLDAGFDIQQALPTRYGPYSVLGAAVLCRRDTVVLEHLLQRKPDLERQGGGRGSKILELAISTGRPEKAMLIWDAGGEIDPDRSGFLLNKAAAAGLQAIAVRLVRGGAELNFRDSDGYTGLIHASGRGDLETVKLLVESGADLDQNTKGAGFTALRLAREKKRDDVVAYLVEKGARE